MKLGGGAAWGPNLTVTLQISRSTLASPCSGGPRMCTDAPIEMCTSIVTQAKKQIRLWNPADTVTPALMS